MAFINKSQAGGSVTPLALADENILISIGAE
jgi:hypothetical protein